MTFGSLFAGIGGFDLGFERAGLRCLWQVELNEWCRRVLAKHWPNVRRHDDVRTFEPGPDEWVDVICGGFPCQDISNAGKRVGIGGARSGLWSEFARIVRLLRPRFVVVENVPALSLRGLDRVLGDLAVLGFDAEWDCLPAAAFGAPHLRRRLFVVAHFNNGGGGPGTEPARREERTNPGRGGSGSEVAADACGRRQGLATDPRIEGLPAPQPTGQRVAAETSAFFRGAVTKCDWWATEPDLARMVHGVPDRIHRIKGLGNAVVPQVAEWIGRRLMEFAK